MCYVVLQALRTESTCKTMTYCYTWLTTQSLYSYTMQCFKSYKRSASVKLCHTDYAILLYKANYGMS